MIRAHHTFLFADLVGFTALTEAEGDDRALEVALELQRRVGALLEQHDAEQVKAIGDCLMLRCPDAAGGVELAVRIVDQLGADPEFPLVRVGVHTGPAIARYGDWYGRTVNVAARLCAVSGGGEVVISEATSRAAGRLTGLEYGARRLHWLRNVTEPVATYAVRRRLLPAPVRARDRCRLTRSRARSGPAT